MPGRAPSTIYSQKSSSRLQFSSSGDYLLSRHFEGHLREKRFFSFCKMNSGAREASLTAGAARQWCNYTEQDEQPDDKARHEWQVYGYHPQIPSRKKSTRQQVHRTGESDEGTSAVRIDPRASALESTGWTFARARDQLHKAPWYWGNVSSSEASAVLEQMPDHSFFVRDSSDPRSLFAVTYRTTGGAIGSTRIQFRNGLFSLNFSESVLTQFDNIVDLIEDCTEKSRRRPVCMVKIGGNPCEVYLRHPLVRQEPMMLQEICRRCVHRHCRRDVLEHPANGLPHTLKAYLLSCPFRPADGTHIGTRNEPAETAV